MCVLRVRQMYKPRHRKKQFKHRRTIARFHLFGTRLTWPSDDWKISKDILWDEMPALGYYWLQNIKLETDPYGKAMKRYQNDFLKTNLTKFTVIWGKRNQKTGVLGPLRFKRRERRARRKKVEGRKSNGCTLSFYLNGHFGLCQKKKCWTQNVHLAVTLPIRARRIYLDLLIFYILVSITYTETGFIKLMDVATSSPNGHLVFPAV